MFVDYTDLNKLCLKDSYPLLNIDKLINNSTEYKLISFMDVYSGYNQISIYEPDRGKTAFMTEQANYQYNIMLFILKDVSPTYQRMMNKVFKEEIGETLEIYIGAVLKF